jgi:hypothetical protein
LDISFGWKDGTLFVTGILDVGAVGSAGDGDAALRSGGATGGKFGVLAGDGTVGMSATGVIVGVDCGAGVDVSGTSGVVTTGTLGGVAGRVGAGVPTAVLGEVA